MAGVVEKLHLTMYAVFTKYNTEVHLLRVPNRVVHTEAEYLVTNKWDLTFKS